MFNEHMMQPGRAVRTDSATSADRHPPVRLREVILIELRCQLRRLGCGHGSPIAPRSEGRLLPRRRTRTLPEMRRDSPFDHRLASSRLRPLRRRLVVPLPKADPDRAEGSVGAFPRHGTFLRSAGRVSRPLIAQLVRDSAPCSIERLGVISLVGQHKAEGLA